MASCWLTGNPIAADDELGARRCGDGSLRDGALCITRALCSLNPVSRAAACDRTTLAFDLKTVENRSQDRGSGTEPPSFRARDAIRLAWRRRL